MPGLPSGRRVIAPREVDEGARTRSLPRSPSLVRMADHLGDLPARRGQALLRLGPRQRCSAAGNPDPIDLVLRS